MKKRKLKSLEFNVRQWDINKGEFQTVNIFNSTMVLWSVAEWVCMSKKERTKIKDPLFFCFSSFWCRVQWEFGVCEPFCKDLNTGVKKVDTYSFYIQPNEKLLMGMIESVSKSSARKYLKEYMKQRQEYVKMNIQ